MRVIIAGGRDFNDYDLLKDKCDAILNAKHKEELVIVSGTAKGADLLGEKYAKQYDIAIDRHPADWDRHGKAAGYKRNSEMAACADALIAFWDGESRGTRMMIELAIEKGLKVRVIKYGIKRD